MRRDELQREAWRGFLAGELPAANQPAQVRPTVAIACKQHQMTEIVEAQLHADDRVEIAFLGTVPKSHRAVETVGVGDRQALEAELDGAVHELLGMRRAIEEGEVRMAVQLGVAP